MTTIKLKNGSGAPATSDLVQGEPALDLTNKRLYTENASGAVIEIGTSPSTIDINAGTIDGTVIGGSTAAAGTFTTFTSTGIDDNADAVAITIDSAGRVLMGTTTEGQGSADDLTIATSGNTGITIRSGTSNEGAIYFSDGTSGVAEYECMLAYDHSSNFLRIITNHAEAARIDSSGSLLVGTTSSQGGHVFSVKGDGATCAVFRRDSDDGGVLNFMRGASFVGSITVASSSTAFNTSSDQRLKENIVDAPAGNIDDIRVRSFDWKADGSHQTYGMVAQELVDVAPEAVTQGDSENDMWAVDYSKLVPMMIKEIQDLKAEVAALKGE